MEVDKDGREYTRFCKCRDTRRALDDIRRSGLAHVIDTLTFDSFDAPEPWQASMKDAAKAYADALAAGSTAWLYFGGQPGSGKTHLCTAVCGELLRSGRAVRYMVWPGTVERIKALRFDDEAMDALLEPLKQADILYIDDLFKTPHREKTDRHGYRHAPKPEPTDADARLCFEIINSRYIADKPTLLSGEWSLLSDLMDVDEATFGRVRQKAGRFVLEISRDIKRDYRLCGGAGWAK